MTVSRPLRHFLIVIGLAVALPGALGAATYYVDFDAGSDANAGTSAQTAWKRAPGDPAATGVPASRTLAPGDTVLFKGGVTYRGSITVNASGASGQPITFKGDGWGATRARVVGADPVALTWTVCASATAARGNPNFANIHYATAPAGFSSFLTGIYENEDFLWYSQGPDVADPFHYDNMSEYHPIPQGSTAIRQTRTTLTDTTRLTQTDATFWNGAHVATWIQGNLVAIKAVTAFNPATDTLTHEDLGAAPYTDRTSYYSLLNHVSLISRPGEYAYEPSTQRLYLWPRASGNPADHTYSVQTRETAFTLGSRSHITIEGFEIRNFAQGVHASSTSATGVIVRNNAITHLRSANKYSVFVNASNSLVENNTISNCMRSVGILSSATRITVRGNTVHRTSRQGVWFMGAKTSEISGNTITDIRGSHANALSIYSSSSDILVAHNVIAEANLPITYEASSNLTFFGNVVDGGDRVRAASEWYGMSGRVAFINNTFVRNPGSAFLYVNSAGSAQYVILNNILDGGGPASSQHDYNLFIGSPGWTLSGHETVHASLSGVVATPSGPDWRPAAGSPAIDTGTQPLAHLPTALFPAFDFARDPHGVARGSGAGWDRGAFEYAGASGPVAPAITTHPANTTVSAGQSATFTVAASGTAPLSYQWQRNGATIAGATASTYTTPPTAASDDGAAYRVVVTNTAGTATSNAAVLAVTTSGGTPGTIAVGARVVVTSDPSLRVRSAAALAASVVGDQPIGATGTVIGGPIVADGYTWWQIDYDSGTDGWSIAGTGATPWLALVAEQIPAAPSGLGVE